MDNPQSHHHVAVQQETSTSISARQSKRKLAEEPDQEMQPTNYKVKRPKREIINILQWSKPYYKRRGAHFTAIINENNLDNTVIGQEPWPDDVKLYQPYETEQILLPDNACCLAVQAFLKMCKLDFTIEYKPNAEYMSPSGHVPFIKCGAFLVAELEPIASFVGNKGISLTQNLSAPEKADMRAYMSLVNTVLGNAENYITWVDNTTYSQVTWQRFGSVHPFPLNYVLTYMKRQSVIKKLSALGWYKKSLEEVYAEVEKCCQALSERLEKLKYFFGDQPCELDALLFGNVYAILSTPSFPAGLRLAEIIRNFSPIFHHCQQIMPLLNMTSPIGEAKLHPLCLSSMSLTLKPSFEEKPDEFVFYDDEEDNDDNLDAPDIGSLTNTENSIYDSLFD